MTLRNLAKVTPKSDTARNNLAQYMNGNQYVKIEQKKENGRIIVSSQTNVDYWFWVDPPDDPHWYLEELK